MIRATTLLSAVCLALVSGGCARNPYVRWQVPDQVTKTDVPADAAIAYARSARGAYQAALGTEAQADAAVGASLITLSALALGLGAADANRDALVGLGLIGGTTYSLRSWYRNKPAELAYLAGIKAIDCAIDAVQPYVDEQAMQDALKADVKKLREKLPKAHGDVSRLQFLLKLSADSALKQAEAAVLDSLDTALKRADQQLAQGEAMIVQTPGIGRALVQTVDNIGSKVDAAVHDNLPELSALPALIGNLASASSIVVPGLELKFNPESLKQKGGPAPQADKVLREQQRTTGFSVDGLVQLIADVAEIDSLGAEIGNAYARIEGKKASDRLKECGVDAVVGMSVDPASITMTSPDTDAQIDIHIRNGKSPYWARLNGEGGSGVTVTSPIRGGSDFPVTIAKGAKGKVHAVVSDSAGHDINVPITINPKETNDDGGNKGNKPGQTPADATDAQLQKTSKEVLAAGVPVLGVTLTFGSITVSQGVLKLDQPSKTFACTDQDALRKAVVGAKDAAGKSLQERWKADSNIDLAVPKNLVFVGLCPGT